MQKGKKYTVRKLSGTTGKAHVEAITAPSASDTEGASDTEADDEATQTQASTMLPGTGESPDLFGGEEASAAKEAGGSESSSSEEEDEASQEESSEEPEVVDEATAEQDPLETGEEEQVRQQYPSSNPAAKIKIDNLSSLGSTYWRPSPSCPPTRPRRTSLPRRSGRTATTSSRWREASSWWTTGRNRTSMSGSWPWASAWTSATMKR